MKLLHSIILITLFATMLNAQTTMCYKENHSDMTTINTTKLDGGLCQSKKSAKEMNNEGWTTEDIKINSNNYIYLFKKVTTINEVNMDELENRVLERMKNEKIEKNKLVKEKLEKSKIKYGKKVYEAKCIFCHGKKGELQKYGKAPIKDLNLRNFEKAIREYTTGERDKVKDSNSINTFAPLMKPYAAMLSPNKIHNIYVYLKSINKNKQNTEEKK
ncbi:hypothetical protein DZA35_00645 [Arcobacter sp. HD9-500m-PIT-SAG03]|nr:hypothetical protein DZA35_00645 [Arcobacter sp. HD9-500m-PIT-SAG03]